MNDILNWINSPDRDFTQGVKLYSKYKTTPKHDGFFVTKEPTLLHHNMLFSFLTKIHSKLKANSKLPTPEKIQPVNPILLPPQAPPIESIRNDKQQTNKLLTIQWEKLNQTEQDVFFRNQDYFNFKVGLIRKNGDIANELTGLHAKLRATPDDPQLNETRSNLLANITSLDDQRFANWSIIDSWNEQDAAHHTHSHSNEGLPSATIIEYQKTIQRNSVYLSRARKIIAGLNTLNSQDKAKYDKKKTEMDKRSAENKRLRTILKKEESILQP